MMTYREHILEDQISLFVWNFLKCSSYNVTKVTPLFWEQNYFLLSSASDHLLNLKETQIQVRVITHEQEICK